MSFLLPFTLKRIISQFLMPVPLVIEMFVLGWGLARFTRFKRMGTACKVLAGCLFLAFGYGCGDSYLFRIERRYPPFDPTPELVDQLRGADVVVLGQGLATESDLPVRLRERATFELRLMEGVRVCRLIPDSRLLVSMAGAAPQSDKYVYLTEHIRAMGFPCERMQMITGAHDTRDEAGLVAVVAKSHTLILATSASHVHRALQIFKKEGFAAIPAPCDYRRICDKRHWKLTALPLPSGGGFFSSDSAVYEWLGSLYERVTD